MIKAIIFDCFGVLVGSGFKDTYRQAGGNPEKDIKFIKKILDDTSLGLLSTEALQQRVSEKLGITISKWQEVVANSEKPKLELLAYIKKLKSKYKVAILSNAYVGVLERKFTPQQLAIFDAVVVSAEEGMIKPDPSLFELTAKRLCVKTEECILVDDNRGYCIAAQAQGLRVVIYHDFDQMKRELEQLLANPNN